MDVGFCLFQWKKRMNGAYSGVQIGKGKEAFSSFTAHTRFPLLKKRKCMAWRIRHFWDSRHSSKVRRDDETGNKKGKEGNTVFLSVKRFFTVFQTDRGWEREISWNRRKCKEKRGDKFQIWEYTKKQKKENTGEENGEKQLLSRPVIKFRMASAETIKNPLMGGACSVELLPF